MNFNWWVWFVIVGFQKEMAETGTLVFTVRCFWITHPTANTRSLDQLELVWIILRRTIGFLKKKGKFVILRALKFKTAEAVAAELLDIYTKFEAPAILHSDNGWEFVNNVLNVVHESWDGVKVVHGKPRHSQSQEGVERANQDIENLIAAWMDEKKDPNWPAALKFIQFQKNRALHSGIMSVLCL